MSKFYKKVVVIGAGTMGLGIAAHLANSKIFTVLLDLPSQEGDKNLIANNAITNIKKSDPPLLVEKIVLNIFRQEILMRTSIMLVTQIGLSKQL